MSQYDYIGLIYWIQREYLVEACCVELYYKVHSDRSHLGAGEKYNVYLGIAGLRDHSICLVNPIEIYCSAQ
jgi:hypothetical protein